MYKGGVKKEPTAIPHRLQRFVKSALRNQNYTFNGPVNKKNRDKDPASKLHKSYVKVPPNPGSKNKKFEWFLLRNEKGQLIKQGNSNNPYTKIRESKKTMEALHSAKNQMDVKKIINNLLSTAANKTAANKKAANKIAANKKAANKKAANKTAANRNSEKKYRYEKQVKSVGKLYKKSKNEKSPIQCKNIINERTQKKNTPLSEKEFLKLTKEITNASKKGAKKTSGGEKTNKSLRKRPISTGSANRNNMKFKKNDIVFARAWAGLKEHGGKKRTASWFPGTIKEIATKNRKKFYVVEVDPLNGYENLGPNKKMVVEPNCVKEFETGLKNHYYKKTLGTQSRYVKNPNECFNFSKQPGATNNGRNIYHVRQLNHGNRTRMNVNHRMKNKANKIIALSKKKFPLKKTTPNKRKKKTKPNKRKNKTTAN
jgi:hypothetical protein